MVRFLWRSTRGYRLRPWRSPYVRWRMETYWGVPASEIGFGEFWRFAWQHRAEMLRFLRWADRMESETRRQRSGVQRRTGGDERE